MSNYLGMNLASVRTNACVNTLSMNEYATVPGWTNANTWNSL